jgi:hypothetical protein
VLHLDRIYFVELNYTPEINLAEHDANDAPLSSNVIVCASRAVIRYGGPSGGSAR